ncbi:aminofutalosine synthase MqnE [Pseudodesulfovibrio senegalensis]|uniref:Aminodeoxyfutalosine synthase n=1 Tax=Pseudodesulfovibrio senegalensis TaxID=1721087 RepID=A0A6N6N638_9BACT|nr:aminofutalosine synthase MqnE [Pseudodesulfovibrio senegalensis]KAB1442356.1 aminofutalosine synthase MqnE [Pseudodesulfovibrio senegalensis]
MIEFFIKNNFYANLGLGDVQEKVMEGKRLSREDGLRLFECDEPLAVGTLAHHVRTRMHGRKTYHVVNQHINYTNVCVNGCVFCAYQREDESRTGAFTLSMADVAAKLDANAAEPNEIHIVGGCHPTLPLSYYEELLALVRERLPHTVIKSFTVTEIAHFASLAKLSTAEVLTRLRTAGLDMLTGGGAEIFDPEIRQQICPRKIDADEWLRIHGEAHAMGIRTNCTMLYGHLESREHRVDHLIRLREQQDASGGFTCFIPLPFLTENSKLKVPSPLTGLEQLRTIAISRLMLDNISHIKSYWIMLGVKVAQAALKFGADDFDGTVVEEKIGHEAGADSAQSMSVQELEGMIRGCGMEPVRRDAQFNEV